MYGIHFPWLLLPHLEHRKDNITYQGRNSTGLCVYEELKGRSKRDLNHILLVLSCEDLWTEFASFNFCNYVVLIHEFWLLCITVLHSHNQTTVKLELLTLKLFCTVWFYQFRANIVYLRLCYIEIHSRIKHVSRKCQEPHFTQCWLEISTKCSLGHHFLSIFIRKMTRCCPFSCNRQWLGPLQ